MTAEVGPPRPVEPLAAAVRAEDPGRPHLERLVWAVLAAAGEVRELRRDLRKRR